MKSRYEGCIADVLAVEDHIRATHKYTKGAFTRPAKHPIQGGEIPSRVLTEYYEVYPHLELKPGQSLLDLPASTGLDLLWGEIEHITVQFHYDYRVNKARMVVKGGDKKVKSLSKGIPGFGESIARLTNGNKMVSSK